MLEVKNLHATIAGKEILKGINLTVNDGEIHAVMGPNGSGKTTLLKLCLGLISSKEGTIKIFGEDIKDTTQKNKIFTFR